MVICTLPNSKLKDSDAKPKPLVMDVQLRDEDLVSSYQANSSRIPWLTSRGALTAEGISTHSKSLQRHSRARSLIIARLSSACAMSQAATRILSYFCPVLFAYVEAQPILMLHINRHQNAPTANHLNLDCAMPLFALLLELIKTAMDVFTASMERLHV